MNIIKTTLIKYYKIKETVKSKSNLVWVKKNHKELFL